MISAASKKDGSFYIPSIPSGHYELIISCPGYKSQRIDILSNTVPPNLSIYLTPLNKTIEEVVGVPKDDSIVWNEWGDLFLELLYGYSPFAKKMSLTNPEKVRLSYNRVTNELIARATEPLVLENNALGYSISYELNEFKYQFNKGLIACDGYALLKEMNAKSLKEYNNWVSNRRDAFNGSSLHFFQSLYRNLLAENKFQVRRVFSVENAERKRVVNLIDSLKKNKTSGMIADPHFTPRRKDPSGDSLTYYQKVLHQNSVFDSIDVNELRADSIAYAIDTLTLGFQFSAPLHISYPYNKTMSREIRKIYNVIFFFPELPTIQGRPQVISKIAVNSTLKETLNNKLTTKNEILVFANGTFYPSEDLKIDGHWNYWEGLSMLLPLSYENRHP
jgi:hypothetical protein